MGPRPASAPRPPATSCGTRSQAPYQQPQSQPHAQPQAWPGQQQYEDPYADQQYTQQWQGQTWETQMQPPVPPVAAAEETSYLPPQGVGAAVPQGYPQAQAHAHPQAQAHAQQAQAQVPVSAPVAPAPGAGGGAGPEYGPATLAGNPRITDAQRARAEGRSPIIDPGMQPALLTAVLGLLLAGGAALGTYALLVPLVVLQGLTAAGWFRLNGMWPARQGIALGFLGALAADAAMLLSDRSPAAILGTLGVWVLLSLVLQLRSHADPDERMYGLMATVVAAALAIAAGGYIAADADAVVVGAVAVAAALVARALPVGTAASVVLALVVAAGAGFVVGGMETDGALVGVGAAVCALIGHRVAAYDYPSRFVHFTAGIALPLAAAGPAVYILGRVFG
ncbi:hypothetical protein [Streptomyces sp. PAL114]|uniref:hypothetical protein n=1 Tax=Streptomyces sp. PAL114 TaxID=2970893 RepID=UPI0028FDA519|nr:hypothetical protein [Streptomyces sp. PAL114]MDU0305463.1 hypothetical protein [Streptomyces sp. PAL114]